MLLICNVSNSLSFEHENFKQIRIFYLVYPSILVKYSVFILFHISGYWPISPSKVTSKLPKEAEIAFERFKNFYLKDHSGRQLNLQPHLGQADINAIFYQKKDDVVSPKRHILLVGVVYSQENFLDPLTYCYCEITKENYNLNGI